MQYTFWQTVIEIGREYAGFDISADFLQHSLKENPENLLITEGKVIEEVKNDNQFQENINNIVKKYGKNKDEFIFDSQVNTDYPMHFDNSDLYFAIHSACLKIIGDFQDEKMILYTREKIYNNIPNIENAYWIFTNRSNGVNDVHSVDELLNDMYYSISFGILDIDNRILYYYEYDR